MYIRPCLKLGSNNGQKKQTKFKKINKELLSSIHLTMRLEREKDRAREDRQLSKYSLFFHVFANLSNIKTSITLQKFHYLS